MWKYLLVMALLTSMVVAQEPPQTRDGTRVEVYGTFKQITNKTGNKTVTLYTIESEGRTWRLECGTDRVINYIAQRVDGKPVIVTGKLRIDDKLDTLTVTRIEPQDDVKLETSPQ